MIIDITFQVEIPKYEAALYGYGKDSEGKYPKLNNLPRATKWLRGAGKEHMFAAIERQIIIPANITIVEEDIHHDGEIE